MTPDQFEVPSLSTAHWCVHIRAGAYHYLKAFVAAQQPLADLHDGKARMAVIAEGRLAAAERQTSADGGSAAVSKAQAAVWWSALNGYPPWVIRSAFLHCNTVSKFAPRPAEVAERCGMTWEQAGQRISRAWAIVRDVEAYKQEWMGGV